MYIGTGNPVLKLYDTDDVLYNTYTLPTPRINRIEPNYRKQDFIAQSKKPRTIKIKKFYNGLLRWDQINQEYLNALLNAIAKQKEGWTLKLQPRNDAVIEEDIIIVDYDTNYNENFIYNGVYLEIEWTSGSNVSTNITNTILENRFLPNHLVASYPFDTDFSDVKNGYDSNFQSDVAITDEYADFTYGHIDFKSLYNNEYTIYQNKWSYSIWVKNPAGCIFNGRSNYNPDGSFDIILNGFTYIERGDLKWRNIEAYRGDNYLKTISIDTSKWNHIVYVRNAFNGKSGTHSLYVNGQLKSQINVSGTYTSLTYDGGCSYKPYWFNSLGVEKYYTECFDSTARKTYIGKMDNFNIFNIALTSREVEFIYNLGRERRIDLL